MRIELLFVLLFLILYSTTEPVMLNCAFLYVIPKNNLADV